MYRSSSQKGSLLIEILVAITVIGIIAGIAAQAIVASLDSNAVAGARGQQSDLLAEMMQGISASSDGSWNNLYSLAADGSHYHVAIANGKWVITSGDDTVSVVPRTFIRYFTVTNVSRDPTTRAIESTYNTSHDDPSTRLVQAYVVSSTTNTLSVNEYFFRWRNQICDQNAWASSGLSGTTTCTSGAYNSSSNITPGSSLKLCSGGC